MIRTFPDARYFLRGTIAYRALVEETRAGSLVVTMRLDSAVVNPPFTQEARPHFGLDGLVLRTVSGAMLATWLLSGGAGSNET
jgi:hypothetical protein